MTACNKYSLKELMIYFYNWVQQAWAALLPWSDTCIKTW